MGNAVNYRNFNTQYALDMSGVADGTADVDFDEFEDGDINDNLIDMASMLSVDNNVVGLPKEPPRGCLPEELEQVIDNAANAFDTTRNVAMGSCIGWLASCVNGQALVRFKKGNPQPGVLWVCISEPSGGGKSACGNFFFSRILEVQRQLALDYIDELDLLEENAEAPEPERPPYPLCGDVTLQGLINCFIARPTGIGLFADELHATLNRFGVRSTAASYPGRIADYLMQFYDGSPWMKERAKAKDCLFIPHCYLSIFGGIQPERLIRSMSEDNLISGFLGRFTIIRSTRSNMPVWHNEDISHSSQEVVNYMTDSLLTLHAKLIHTGGEKLLIDVSDEALHDLWQPWYHKLQNHVWKNYPDDQGLAMKMSMQASRIALLVHLAEQVCAAPKKIPATTISGDTLAKALTLSDWIAEQKWEIIDLVKAKTEREKIYEARPNDIKVAKVIIDHLDDIREVGGIIPNSVLKRWVDETGIEISSTALGKVCSRLDIARVKSGRRGIKIDSNTFSALNEKFRLATAHRHAA